MNFKKRIAAIATAAACSLSMAAFGTSDVNDVNVYAAGVTGKTAFEITEDMTIGWNLGNSLDSSGAAEGSGFGVDPKVAATKWGNPEPTQALFDAVQAGGFNTVRIPTTWYEHIKQDANGFWEIDPLWMDYVKKTVDYAYNNGMYVILNVHHEAWVNVDRFTDNTKAAASERLEDIWTQVSEEFADYDQRLVFEGMNEPRQTYDPSVEWGGGDANSWQYINDLNAIFVDTVRGQGSAANKERVLMLPGYCASSGVDTVRQIAIPEGSGNIALSVHAYLPYFFTMDTSNMSNHEYKADGSSASGYGANYKQELQTFFNNMKSVMSEKNAPIIIGEFSASDFGNTDSRVNWAKDYMSMSEDAGIPCVLWDNNATYTEGAAPSGENHGYINRKSNKWYAQSAPVIEAMMQTIGVADYELPVYTPAAEFSWANVNIGSDWIKLFKADKGQQTVDKDGNPDGWANIEVKGYEEYLNENYKFVMFAEGNPTLVLMTSNLGSVDGQGWNYIMDDGTSTEDFVYNFSYNDIKSAVEATGDSLDNKNGFFMSAHGSPITAYALYAVPVKSQVEPTEPTTEQPTEQPTETTVTEQPTETTTTTVAEKPTETTVSETTAPTEAPSVEFGTPSLLGDVDVSGSIDIADLTTLAKNILNSNLFPLSGDVARANADVNADKKIDTSDTALLGEYILKKITSFN